VNEGKDESEVQTQEYPQDSELCEGQSTKERQDAKGR